MYGVALAAAKKVALSSKKRISGRLLVLLGPPSQLLGRVQSNFRCSTLELDDEEEESKREIQSKEERGLGGLIVS